MILPPSYACGADLGTVLKSRDGNFSPARPPAIVKAYAKREPPRPGSAAKYGFEGALDRFYLTGDCGGNRAAGPPRNLRTVPRPPDLRGSSRPRNWPAWTPAAGLESCPTSTLDRSEERRVGQRSGDRRS